MALPQSATIGQSRPQQAERPLEKIAIIVAMRDEAEPIIQTLNLSRSHNQNMAPQLGLVVYSGVRKEREIFLIVNGVDTTHGVDKVGTTPATLTAYETIRTINPDVIISAGTAGGFASKGAKLGDVYLSTQKFVYHDRRIPLGNFNDYGLGSFPCLEVPAIATALNLKMGVISTGNALTLSPIDQYVLMQSNAVAKEMEVAAIAEVAQAFGTPVMAVKAITNLAGVHANAPEEFEKNFATATHNLAQTLPSILDHMLGKTPQQLRSNIALINNKPNKGPRPSTPLFKTVANGTPFSLQAPPKEAIEE